MTGKPDPAPHPAGLLRRQAAAGAALALLAGLAALATPRAGRDAFAAEPLTLLTPDRIGPWRAVEGGQDVVPQTLDDEPTADRSLLRSFVAEGLPGVMTAASYHAPSSRDVKVHRPEVCYENGGFALSNLRDLDLDLGGGVVLPARAFTGVRGSRVEQVVYWSRIAEAFPQSLTEQRLAMIRYGMRGVAADGLLMRFSSIGPPSQARLDRLTEFARLVFAAAGPTARRMMVGRLAGPSGAAAR